MGIEDEITAELQKLDNVTPEDYHAIARKFYHRLSTEYERKFGAPVPHWVGHSGFDPDTSCCLVEKAIENGVPLRGDDWRPSLPEGYQQEDGGVIYGANWLDGE